MVLLNIMLISFSAGPVHASHIDQQMPVTLVRLDSEGGFTLLVGDIVLGACSGSAGQDKIAAAHRFYPPTMYTYK